jgi:hypothetical protein
MIASAPQRFPHLDGELSLGCQLVTPRPGYTHCGIYAGAGLVVHYSGLSNSLRRGPIELVSLETFAGGHEVWIEPTPCARYAGWHAVTRALSRLGEDQYRLVTNNCEHFCAWCLDGEARSRQVERRFAWPRAARHAMRRIAGAINGTVVKSIQRLAFSSAKRGCSA